ncbi:glycosyltransferase family 25 protein [Psychrobacter sp. HD31]|uniref:glycosyltransferase family 25 protein n=1 Tax=Psychrobacter sp. HD31 TaxID=3112003 RepID=UPI003DA3409E
MHTFYIVSLKSDIQRRTHIEKMFNSLDILFQFFDAVNKQNLSDILNQYPIKFKENSLTQGEQGCFMSHYLLWQKMLDKNIPYMIIAEDDVILSRKTHTMLDNLDKIMEQCDILKFETMQMPVLVDNDCDIIEGICKLKELASEHWGTAGYVITNEMAKELCQRLSKESIKKPVDHILFDDAVKTYKIYQTIPGLAIQEDVLNRNTNMITLHSSLEEERKKRRRKVAKNKVSREFKRLLSQLKPEYWRLKRREKYIKKNGVIIPFDNQSLTKDVTQ